MVYIKIFDGDFPTKKYSENIHKFQCGYVEAKGNGRILFDYVDNYKNIGDGRDIRPADGGKIQIRLIRMSDSFRMGYDYNFIIDKDVF